MRSSSGPERRRRWRARSACEQWQRVPPSPHGHGFEAATSMKRVGKTITCWPRTIVTWPSSSGWRSASRLGRANSDELVQEQHAAVGERRLARLRRVRAADQAGGRDRVVRRAERALA